MSVPPHVLAASLAALELHDPDVAVAQLVRDSVVDGEFPCTLPGARSLCFENEQVTVHINVVPLDASRRHVSIAVTPAEYDRGTLLQPGDGIRLDLPPLSPSGPDEADDQDTERESTGGPIDVGAGLTSLVLRRAGDDVAVRTAWVVF